MEQESKPQGWWQSLPGVITATGGFLTALTALVVALHQAGLFGKSDASGKTEAVAPERPAGNDPAAEGANRVEARAENPVDRKTEAPEAPANGDSTDAGQEPPRSGGEYDPRAVLLELKAANIGASVGEGKLLDWLDDDDRTYRRIAENSLEILAGKRMNGAAPDIDVIKYKYLELSHRDGAGLLPLGERVNRPLLKQAILMASNEKNGGNLKRFERALANR